jgi:2-polyprenyl-6-hydroxyphenyl methylase/3-demethylubiquinone-9 3-methyltransferase
MERQKTLTPCSSLCLLPLACPSQVIEHVREPAEFISVLSQLLRPQEALSPEPGSSGGKPRLLFLSTLNRSVPSYAVAILGAEYITGAVPRGTHDWSRFITPSELTLMAANVRRFFTWGET